MDSKFWPLDLPVSMTTCFLFQPYFLTGCCIWSHLWYSALWFPLVTIPEVQAEDGPPHIWFPDLMPSCLHTGPCFRLRVQTAPFLNRVSLLLMLQFLRDMMKNQPPLVGSSREKCAAIRSIGFEFRSQLHICKGVTLSLHTQVPNQLLTTNTKL